MENMMGPSYLTNVHQTLKTWGSKKLEGGQANLLLNYSYTDMVHLISHFKFLSRPFSSPLKSDKLLQSADESFDD